MSSALTTNIEHKIWATELKGFRDKSLGAIRFTNKALYFETRLGIHTFFVKNAIDIIILDKEERIIKIKENLLPNRIFLWNPKYFRVLELPIGEIKKLKLKLGSIISLNL